MRSVLWLCRQASLGLRPLFSGAPAPPAVKWGYEIPAARPLAGLRRSVQRFYEAWGVLFSIVIFTGWSRRQILLNPTHQTITVIPPYPWFPFFFWWGEVSVTHSLNIVNGNSRSKQFSSLKRSAVLNSGTKPLTCSVPHRMSVVPCPPCPR